MKVSIELSPEYRIPYAVIYADKITDEIQKIMEILSRQKTPITALQNEIESIRRKVFDEVFGLIDERQNAIKREIRKSSEEIHLSLIHI